MGFRYWLQAFAIRKDIFGWVRNTTSNRVEAEIIGEKNQVPPKFSAIKVNGQRAYSLARKGKKFTLKSRKVFLKKICIVNKENEKKVNSTTFEIECGKGFYVRSLSRDICKKLNLDGHIIKLKRIKSEQYILC